MASKCAAKYGDEIFSDNDMHLVVPPNGPAVLLKHVFSAPLRAGLSSNVNIMKAPAATLGSSSDLNKRHDPAPPGRRFVNEPTNLGKIIQGSGTVFINGKPAARDGDIAQTCGDPDAPVGRVIAAGSVFIG